MGAGGSNDTGWIELSAEGADPSNGTFAYGDLFLDFAPGALIDNMTFEVKVDGSDGLWAYEPQITLLDTQTQILDWTDLGGFGVQNTFTENQPGLVLVEFLTPVLNQIQLVTPAGNYLQAFQ